MNRYERSLGRTGVCAEVFQKLLKILDGKTRHYHGSAKVSYMLDLFDHHLVGDEGVGDTLLSQEEARILELAIWFHVAAYSSRFSRVSSAEKSAKKARTLLASQVSLGELERICAIIIALGEGEHGGDRLAKLLIDLDHSILAAGNWRYDWYREAVHAENLWMSRTSYQKARVAHLQAIIARMDLCSALSAIICDGDESLMRERALININYELRG